MRSNKTEKSIQYKRKRNYTFQINFTIYILCYAIRHIKIILCGIITVTCNYSP